MTGLRIVRVAQAAQLLGVSRSTLWRWVRDGLMPRPIRLGPVARGWNQTDLERWLSERTHGAVRPERTSEETKLAGTLAKQAG